MKNLKIFKNISNKNKLVMTCFSLALITSIATGCLQTENIGYYVAYNEKGQEIVLTAKQYNELIESNKEDIIIRSYGGTLVITKEALLEATYQKEAPSSLHK